VVTVSATFLMANAVLVLLLETVRRPVVVFEPAAVVSERIAA
jgi:hypothetical protein